MLHPLAHNNFTLSVEEHDMRRMLGAITTRTVGALTASLDMC